MGTFGGRGVGIGKLASSPLAAWRSQVRMLSEGSRGCDLLQDGLTRFACVACPTLQVRELGADLASAGALEVSREIIGCW